LNLKVEEFPLPTTLELAVQPELMETEVGDADPSQIFDPPKKILSRESLPAGQLRLI